MSWNIQDSTGDRSNKFENNEFLTILKQANILCLQETKKQVKIEGYLSFNSNRKNSRSGGVCILAENDLRKGVSCVPCSESDDIIVVKLDKNFFKLYFDLFLVCYYISPAYSSYVKKYPDCTAKTFSALDTLCIRLRQKEAYLRIIKIPDVRKSLTRFRISCHNLYIERGRYETPLVPSEERWCTYCFFSKGLKPIEDESHVLIDCLLYSSVREKFNFHPQNIVDLVGLLSNKTLDPTTLTATARAIHSFLSVNEHYTAYYKSPDFHSNTGKCIML